MKNIQSIHINEKKVQETDVGCRLKSENIFRVNMRKPPFLADLSSKR